MTYDSWKLAPPPWYTETPPMVWECPDHGPVGTEIDRIGRHCCTQPIGDDEVCGRPCLEVPA